MTKPTDSELVDLLIALADAINFHVDHNDPDADLGERARSTAQSFMPFQEN